MSKLEIVQTVLSAQTEHLEYVPPDNMLFHETEQWLCLKAKWSALEVFKRCHSQ